MKDTSTALKSLFEALAKYFGKVEKVMNDDGQHNQRETDEKLKQLNKEKETQDMLKRLDEMKEVNQILR